MTSRKYPNGPRKATGILVPSGNVRQAAAAVLRLTRDRDTWRAWSAAARRIAEQEFAAEPFGERNRSAILRSLLRIYSAQAARETHRRLEQETVAEDNRR